MLRQRRRSALYHRTPAHRRVGRGSAHKGRWRADSRRRHALLARLHNLAVAIAGVQGREALLQRLYQEIAPLFACEGFVVALCSDSPESEVEIALAIEAGEVVSDVQGRCIPHDQSGLIAWVLQSRRPLLVHNLETAPWPTAGCPVGRSARAWLGVPLMVQDRLIGAVALYSARPYAFDQQDLLLLEAMAQQVSVALENSRLSLETQRRDAMLAGLAEISQLLLAPVDLSQVLPEVLARLGTAACVSRCYIFENQRSPEGVLLTSQRYEWVTPGVSPRSKDPRWQDLPYVASGLGRWAEQLGAGQPVYGPVKRFPPVEQDFLEAQGIRSIAVVPIFSDRSWWGFLGFDDCVSERTWSAAELEALKSAAAVLGAALTRQRVQAAERQQRLLAETLRDTALALTSALSYEDLLDRVLANAQRLVPSDAASLFLVEGDLARVVRTRGYAERGLEEFALAMTFRIAENYNLAAMMATRQPLLIRDVRSVQGWQELPTSQWIGSYLGVPIEVDGEVIGFLNLDFAERDAVPPEGPLLLQAYAAQVGAALVSARLYQVLEAQVARTRQLALDLMQAQEAERLTVVRKLHDDIGQALTALLLNLGALERSLASRAERRDLERLAEARWLAEHTADSTRRLSLDLRPPALDDLGLVPAVRWYLDQLARRTSLPISLQTRGAEQPVPPTVALAAYRSLQEVIAALSSQANSGQLVVTLDFGAEAVSLQIEAEGQGLDAAASDVATNLSASYELRSTRERALALGGECLIYSQPGRGVLVRVQIPLEAAAPDAPFKEFE